jgi:peptidoglycan/xylan/chitin deacetylase (PgdA/CDA1 family)
VTAATTQKRSGWARRAKLGLARTLHVTRLTEAFLQLRRGEPLVLRYHRVYPDGLAPLYELGVPRSLFEAQLDFLKTHCAVVSLGEVCAGLFEGAPLPDRAVTITFDDGYRDNLTEALPALKARGLPATVFVTAGHVETGEPFWWDRVASAFENAPDGEVQVDGERARLSDAASRLRIIDAVCERAKLMPHSEARAWIAELEQQLGAPDRQERSVLTWDEVRALRNDGVEIGSHTLDHPVLSRMEPAEAERQIVESRRLLEEHLDSPVTFFAYPNGKRDDLTPEVVAAVRRAGYRAALTTIEGRAGSNSDPYRIERVGVTLGSCTDASASFSEALFATELSGAFSALFLRRRRDRALH